MKVFKNVEVIFPDEIKEAVVVTDNGKIVGIHNRLEPTSDMEVIDGNGLYLSPGFIDIHVHGGGGYSVMSCNVDDVINMCHTHAKFGTTSIVPTTLTSPMPLLMKAIKTVKSAKEKCTVSNILGIHLEGPFLSFKMCGAQSTDSILVASEHDYAPLLDAWDGILMMGAAPETDGAMKLGEEITKRGIVASVAHSDATYDQVLEAKKHGYSDVTHIYSACSSVIRINAFRVAGVVEAGLVDDDLSVQVIADLKHLPVSLLKLIYKCKGADKISLISDGLEFAGADLAEGTVCMQENGVGAIYEDGVMKVLDRSKLAGSVATSNRLVRNMYQAAEVPLVDAVKMATVTPASVIGVDNYKGKIEVGYDSDIILFNDHVDVKFSMVKDNIILNELR